MKACAVFQIATVAFLAVMPSALSVLHAADGESPRPEVEGGQVHRLIAEERWSEALKLAPVAGQIPGQRNMVEASIQTIRPILIDWDVCASKSTVKDPARQRPEIYRYPWVEFYPSPAGKDPEGLWAALHLQYSSWPKTAWRVTLRRLDRAGAAVFFHRTWETVHENSGTIERVPSLEDAVLKWRVGDHRDVPADPGRLFQTSLETLWTEQGNPMRWDEEMPLSLDLGSLESSKVFRAQGLKLEKVDGDVRAAVQARILSWPKSEWRLTLGLFDQSGRQVGQGTTMVENTGAISSRPGIRQENLRFNIAGAREAMESATRYTLRIECVAAGHERQTAAVHAGPSTNAPAPSNLSSLLAGTTWEWGNGGERIQFGKDGWIDHPGWYQRGLATSWKVIDEHTVLLTIEEGRSVDRYAILVFNADFTEYTGYSFHGAEIFMPGKRVQEGAPNTGLRARIDIELIVDGEVVDLNRLPLPADAPMRDQRSLTAGVADGGSHAADNPKAGAPIDVKKLRLLAWGPPATNGLRAACYFEPTKAAYVDGEVVKRRVVFHNSGNEPVLFTIGLGGNDDGWTVVDERDRKVPLQHVTYSGLVPLRTFRLEPGHATEIDCMAAGLGASANVQHPADTVIQAKPGTTCRVRWTLSVAETKRVENGKGVPVPGVWHGTLTTGEVRFRIVGDLGEGSVTR